MGYFSGKSAVITGAGSGIGRALAQHLNREGCALFLSDINSDTLDATVTSLSRKDLDVDTRVLDVADREGMHAWAADIDTQRGHVDIVVNNAGVALMDTAEDGSYEDLEWLMGINFWGVVHGCKAFLPLLRKATQGHLVNISSVFGLFGVPTQSAYNAAKFAVRGYTEALRQEMENTNVHVCCVHPGGIKTNIVRDARGGDEDRSVDERHDRFQQIARTTAESAAAQIATAMERRKKRLLIGLDAQIMSLVVRLFPVAYPAVLAKLAPAEPDKF